MLKSILQAFREVFVILSEFIDREIYYMNGHLISYEASKWLAHDSDRIKYRNAIRKCEKNKSGRASFVTHKGEKINLYISKR